MVQYGAVIARSILSKSFTIDTPYLAREGEACGVFCEYRLCFR